MSVKILVAIMRLEIAVFVLAVRTLRLAIADLFSVVTTAKAIMEAINKNRMTATEVKSQGRIAALYCPFLAFPRKGGPLLELNSKSLPSLEYSALILFYSIALTATVALFFSTLATTGVE